MKESAGIYSILESLQYGLLYLVAAFIAGVSLDFAFPIYDPQKPTNKVFQEVMGQCLSLVVTVILVRYCVKSVPLLLPIKGTGYVPYHTAEYNGEMMMSFIFIASQMNLINKVNLLSNRLYMFLFKDERKLIDGEHKRMQVRASKHL